MPTKDPVTGLPPQDAASTSASTLSVGAKRQSYFDRKSKGKKALSAWIANDVAEALRKLQKTWGLKSEKDAIEKAIRLAAVRGGK